MLARSCSKRKRDFQLVAAPLVQECMFKPGCIRHTVAGLPAATTDRMGRVNSAYQARFLFKRAAGDHGPAPSPQSQSAFWIYESAGWAKMSASSY